MSVLIFNDVKYRGRALKIPINHTGLVHVPFSIESLIISMYTSDIERELCLAFGHDRMNHVLFVHRIKLGIVTQTIHVSDARIYFVEFTRQDHESKRCNTLNTRWEPMSVVTQVWVQDTCNIQNMIDHHLGHQYRKHSNITLSSFRQFENWYYRLYAYYSQWTRRSSVLYGMMIAVTLCGVLVLLRLFRMCRSVRTSLAKGRHKGVSYALNGPGEAIAFDPQSQCLILPDRIPLSVSYPGKHSSLISQVDPSSSRESKHTRRYTPRLASEPQDVIPEAPYTREQPSFSTSYYTNSYSSSYTWSFSTSADSS